MIFYNDVNLKQAMLSFHSPTAKKFKQTQSTWSVASKWYSLVDFHGARNTPEQRSSAKYLAFSNFHMFLHCSGSKQIGVENNSAKLAEIPSDVFLCTQNKIACF